MVFGQVPQPATNGTDTFPDYQEDKLLELRNSTAQVVATLRAAALDNLKAHRAAITANCPRISPRKYSPGDWVWCYRSELDSTYTTLRKVIERWDGPLRVTEAHAGGTYTRVTDQGLPYRCGISVSHTRLTPVKKASKLLDYVTA